MFSVKEVIPDSGETIIRASLCVETSGGALKWSFNLNLIDSISENPGATFEEDTAKLIKRICEKTIIYCNPPHVDDLDDDYEESPEEPRAYIELPGEVYDNFKKAYALMRSIWEKEKTSADSDEDVFPEFNQIKELLGKTYELNITGYRFNATKGISNESNFLLSGFIGSIELHVSIDFFDGGKLVASIPTRPSNQEYWKIENIKITGEFLGKLKFLHKLSYNALGPKTSFSWNYVIDKCEEQGIDCDFLD